MNAPCLNVGTRSKYADYVYKGDCGENFYQVLKANPNWSDICRFIDTRVPCVLLLEDNLFVVGIPTRRVDKVNTKIRWSFHLRHEKSCEWFAPLVDAFENGSILNLGDHLDSLCGIAGNNDDFTAPTLSSFMDCLKNSLGTPQPSLKATFVLWTAFQPTNPEELKDFLNGLTNLPEGEIRIKGTKEPLHKKKTQANAGLWIATLLLLAAGTVAIYFHYLEAESPLETSFGMDTLLQPESVPESKTQSGISPNGEKAEQSPGAIAGETESPSNQASQNLPINPPAEENASRKMAPTGQNPPPQMNSGISGN